MPATFNIAALPPTLDNVRKQIWVNDLYGGAGGYCISNGVNWRPIWPYAMRAVTAADLTLDALSSAPTQIMTGAIGTGVTRTITVSTAYAYAGARFRICNKTSGLGTLLAGLGLALAANNWRDLEYDGAAWVQTGSGGLL